MVTTRYSDQRDPNRDKKLCGSTSNGTDQYQNGSSNLLTPYREQPRSTRNVVALRDCLKKNQSTPIDLLSIPCYRGKNVQTFRWDQKAANSLLLCISRRRWSIVLHAVAFQRNSHGKMLSGINQVRLGSKPSYYCTPEKARVKLPRAMRGGTVSSATIRVINTVLIPIKMLEPEAEVKTSKHNKKDRLPKRVTRRESLENAEKRGPGGKEERMDGLRGRGSSAIWASRGPGRLPHLTPGPGCKHST